MYIEFAVLAGSAFFFAAIVIRDGIRVRAKVQEIEAQLRRMQRELDLLASRESCDFSTVYVDAKVETPKVDIYDPQFEDARFEIGGGDIDTVPAAPNTVSIASDKLIDMPILQASSSRTSMLRESLLPLSVLHHAMLRGTRLSFSGAKIPLVVGTVALSLAYIFAFERSPRKTDVATLATTLSVDAQLAVTVPPPQAPPTLIEAQGVPAGIVETREAQAPSVQMARRAEGMPNESATAPKQPTPDMESTRVESETIDGRSGKLPDPSPGAEAPLLREAQERSPSEPNMATDSTTSPVATQPVMPAPAPQAGLPSIEAQGMAAKMEAEPKVQTPSLRPTAPDSTPNDGTPEIATLQPTPHLEKPSAENRTKDDPAVGKGSNVGEAHPGVWTHCVVSLMPSGQIAVQHATSYQTCISAGRKCARARRYVDIQFFPQPSLTSTNPPELCDLTP